MSGISAAVIAVSALIAVLENHVPNGAGAITTYQPRSPHEANLYQAALEALEGANPGIASLVVKAALQNKMQASLYALIGIRGYDEPIQLTQVEIAALIIHIMHMDEIVGMPSSRNLVLFLQRLANRTSGGDFPLLTACNAALVASGVNSDNANFAPLLRQFMGLHAQHGGNLDWQHVVTLLIRTMQGIIATDVDAFPLCRAIMAMFGAPIPLVTTILEVLDTPLARDIQNRQKTIALSMFFELMVQCNALIGWNEYSMLSARIITPEFGLNDLQGAYALAQKLSALKARLGLRNPAIAQVADFGQDVVRGTPIPWTVSRLVDLLGGFNLPNLQLHLMVQMLNRRFANANELTNQMAELMIHYNNGNSISAYQLCEVMSNVLEMVAVCEASFEASRVQELAGVTAIAQAMVNALPVNQPIDVPDLSAMTNEEALVALGPFGLSAGTLCAIMAVPAAGRQAIAIACHRAEHPVPQVAALTADLAQVRAVLAPLLAINQVNEICVLIGAIPAPFVFFTGP